MEGQGVNGAAGWRQYSITIPCFALAKTLNFGFLLNGPGTAWIDDLELLVDGVPIALASADIGAPAAVTLDGKSAAATYDGIGAISGGGGNSVSYTTTRNPTAPKFSITYSNRALAHHFNSSK